MRSNVVTINGSLNRPHPAAIMLIIIEDTDKFVRITDGKESKSLEK